MSKREIIAILLDLPEILFEKSKNYSKGDYLVPLSIDKIRNDYYNFVSNKYKKIEHFSPQSSADRLKIIEVIKKNDKISLKVLEEYDDPKEQHSLETNYPDQMIHTIYPQYFTPNGDLIEENKGKKKIMDNWLKSNLPGPYLQGRKKPFYYLGGKLDDERFRAQICAGPANVLSYDCLDSITMWVLE
jgi:hypothetical protein